ncbi:unnamed protein product [Plutella xylostella]|uniref:(diamondback moth) hypothetical protein n=1 Tax=Plutella xylostella TaxID=51655 RepID=A0A8S4G1T8_PLUXY|nr:unnamed protein product [Plutella xylostella]
MSGTLAKRISCSTQATPVHSLVRLPPIISDNSTRSLVASEGESKSHIQLQHST